MSNEREAFQSWMVSIEGARIKPRFDMATAGPFAGDYRDGQVQGAFNAFQAGAEWQRSQQSAPAGYVMVPVDLLERAAESIESELDARYGKPVHPALQKKYASDTVEVEEIRNLLAAWLEANKP